MGAKVTNSVFASALNALIEGSPYLRSQWATILDVSKAAVTQWLNGTSVPKPEHLRGILEVCEESTGVSVDALRNFKLLLEFPPEMLGAGGERFRRTLDHHTISWTIGDYCVTPLLHAFLGLYETLPYQEKERVLLIATDVTHYPRKPHLDRLWPELSYSVATDLREVLAGLSEWAPERQEEFVRDLSNRFDLEYRGITAVTELVKLSKERKSHEDMTILVA